MIVAAPVGRVMNSFIRSQEPCWRRECSRIYKGTKNKVKLKNGCSTGTSQAVTPHAANPSRSVYIAPTLHSAHSTSRPSYSAPTLLAPCPLSPVTPTPLPPHPPPWPHPAVWTAEFRLVCEHRRGKRGSRVGHPKVLAAEFTQLWGAEGKKGRVGHPTV
jgi:hypothetical protein